MGSSFGEYDDLLLSHDDRDREWDDLSSVSEDHEIRTANWVNGNGNDATNDGASTVTVRSERESDWRMMVREFVEKVGQLTDEYKKDVQEANQDVMVELEECKATIEQLKQQAAENVELKRKLAELNQRSAPQGRGQLQLTATATVQEDESAGKMSEIISEKLLAELEICKLRKRLVIEEKVREGLVASGVKMGDENRAMLTKIAELEAGKKAQLAEKTVDLHRYFNKYILDHFYTTDPAEIGPGNLAWDYEGVVGRVFSSPVDGSLPLFRYWSSAIRDHHYTLNWTELRGGNGTYEFGGIACYLFPTPMQGTKPLFRYFHPQRTDHFLTTNWAELEGGQHGWMCEGIVGYLY